MMNDYAKMRKCSHLLPDPGGEVVRELLDEIDAYALEIGKLRADRDRLADEKDQQQVEIDRLREELKAATRSADEARLEQGRLQAELAAVKADLSTEKDAHLEWRKAYFDK
jgi:chromosome segregation ATPase